MDGIPGRFGAVVTAMVTPFDPAGELDLDVAANLARWLTGNGSDALVVAGTTGEAAVLTDAEKKDLWRAVSEAVSVPVIAGSGTNDTRHSLELVTAAEEVGAAAVLAVTPYYNRPSQAGIEAHFRAIAEATSLPVILYDIPSRTGRKVEQGTILRLAREVPNVAGLKDAGGNPGATARLLAEAPEAFEVYSGDDSLTLPLVAVGASGVIGVATHWSGRVHSEMLTAYAKGDVDEARRLNARLLESFQFETSDAAPNPIPTKAMMRVIGLPVGQCRLPMGPAPEGLEDQARLVLSNLGEAAPSLHGPS
ncbi:MAG TPA: 4-hydroxy-tetrahydrodipicolinate synthase, partial [bacterium]|nr:4-hydroxy-tetrahydrodipicolinate synthase [bacterium]